VDQQRTRRTQRRISVSQMLARIRQHIVAVDTRGGNRMRESCTYGSVRGVRGNSHPYRAMLFAALHMSAPGTELPKRDVCFHGESWRVSGLIETGAMRRPIETGSMSDDFRHSAPPLSDRSLLLPHRERS